MLTNAPIGLPGLAVMALGLFAWSIALAYARLQHGSEPRVNATRSRQSMLGIAVQGAAFAVTIIGPIAVTLDPLSPLALLEAGIAALFTMASIALFHWSRRTLGTNWSLVARTRDDHDLIVTGPFAHARHPIYSAIFLLLVAFAVADGHLTHLVVAVPLYVTGTWLRITEEERLLHTLFGPAYDAYAARVNRFVPGLF